MSERERGARLLFDPRRLRAPCLALLTRATDRYLRSALFLQTLRLSLRALSRVHPFARHIPSANDNGRLH